jgi:hypothetical protein
MPHVKRILNAPVGVTTDTAGVDAGLDADGDHLVEKHEVSAPQWQDVLDRGLAADFDDTVDSLARTAGLDPPTLHATIKKVARDDQNQSTAAGASTGLSVALAARRAPPGAVGQIARTSGAFSAAWAAVVQTWRLYDRHERGEKLGRDEVINALATVAYEGLSGTAAGFVAGSVGVGVTAGTAPVIGPAAPVAGVAAGAVAGGATKLALDSAKDALVQWGYALVDSRP